MKRTVKFFIYTVIIVIVLWTALTIYAEVPGPEKLWQIGNINSGRKVLVVFDPDPFYNLDEQVSFSIANELASKGMFVTVASVAAARKIERNNIQLYVFCANTYNWGPDWALSNFISDEKPMEGRNVIAITLGSGSTTRAQRRLENNIVEHKGVLLGSRSLWLLRPNDETRMKESNVSVAISIATTWAASLVK